MGRVLSKNMYSVILMSEIHDFNHICFKYIPWYVNNQICLVLQVSHVKSYQNDQIIDHMTTMKMSLSTNDMFLAYEEDEEIVVRSYVNTGSL